MRIETSVQIVDLDEARSVAQQVVEAEYAKLHRVIRRCVVFLVLDFILIVMIAHFWR